MRVSYTERLTGTTSEVELVPSRQDAFDLVRQLAEIAKRDPLEWKLATRMVMATDLYVLALLSSCSERRDPYTGRHEIDNDFLFNYSREIQAHPEAIDYSAREHWKSTFKTHLLACQEVFCDPDVSIGIFSWEIKAAAKHLDRNRKEMEENRIWKAAWDEVLYANPYEEASNWSVREGIIIKGRRVVSVSPTMAAYSIDRLPAGGRFGVLIFDDIENEKTVESDEVRAKTIERVRNAINLGGRGGRVWVNGTFHHPNGVVNTLLLEGWEGRCHKAEDETKPAPEIAPIFDRYEGRDPATGETLAPEIRNVKLAGAPVYLHPLECAKKRFRQGDPTYNMHNMGDPQAGHSKKFDVTWLRRYAKDPMEWGRNGHYYILADPSKGINDPQATVVVKLGADKTISWVDGFRRRMPPTEWRQEMFFLYAKWRDLGRVCQIRVEQHGQATFAEDLRAYFDTFGGYGGDLVIGTGTNFAHGTKRGEMKRVIEWQRMEPPFRMGKILFPPPGALLVEGDDGNLYDLVDYFIEYEYKKFPLPQTDDLLAAWRLLWEPEEKVGPLLWPDGENVFDDEEDEPPPHRADGDLAWMDEGF